MKEIRQIIQAYNAARAQQKKAVLATVVHIEGSAYRAPGARMLITDDGQLTGAVSGGCLEGDVLRKAMLVMMEEKPMLVTYDTSDEENDLIGVSLGCNVSSASCWNRLLPVKKEHRLRCCNQRLQNVNRLQ